MRCSGNTPRIHHGHHLPSFPERGWIQFLILRLLDEKPTHGYHLIYELENRGYVRAGRFETGSLYTILKRMEMRGLLSSAHGQSETGRVRKVYSITPKGREALKRGLENIIRRKMMMEEFVEYYQTSFRDQDVLPHERKEER